MNGKEPKNSPEQTDVVKTGSPAPIETQDRNEIGAEEVDLEDEVELAIVGGGRQLESEDAGDPSEDDDDNAYQGSDEALPDDEEEAEIARNQDRGGRRFDD